MKRRTAFQLIGASVMGAVSAPAESEAAAPKTAQDPYGCLVDTTLCVGCRECEKACNRANELPPQQTGFSDPSVFEEARRPDEDHFTVVNRYAGAPSPDQEAREDTYVKVQCMHCQDPSCVSACIVGALQKTSEGPVIYDEDRCIGCRYCMVACPFQIPAYEYEDPLAPRVRKCSLCFDNRTDASEPPACVKACPREAIVFGKREDLLTLARKKIEDNPARYNEHIYGEHEVGGTSWLYLTGRPHEELGLLPLPENAPPRLTESIQHGIFQYGLPPLALYGALGGIMWATNRKDNQHEETSTEDQE